MILKKLFLYPDLVEFVARKPDVQLIRDQTRYVCNYIERRLSEIRFNADGFAKICIVGGHGGEVSVNSSSALVSYVPFDIDECLSINKQERGIYYSELLRKGLRRCSTAYDIPEKEIILWLDEFHKLNYRNEWIYQVKSSKKHAIVAALHCNLTIDNFVLNLMIQKNGVDVTSKNILKTSPDEVEYHYKFKDIRIEGDEIIVTTRLHDKDKGILYRMPIP